MSLVVGGGVPARGELGWRHPTSPSLQRLTQPWSWGRGRGDGLRCQLPRAGSRAQEAGRASDGTSSLVLSPALPPARLLWTGLVWVPPGLAFAESQADPGALPSPRPPEASRPLGLLALLTGQRKGL